MKFLLVGDIVGYQGEDTLNKYLAKHGEKYDVIVVNAENIDNGFGITSQKASNLLNNGVDVITLGNHSFDKKDVYEYLNKTKRVIRPYNFSDKAPGNGYTIIEKKNKKIAIVSLQGKVYMNTLHCPFIAIDSLLEDLKEKVDIIVVDFHAEVTSEKRAMGWNVAGKVSIIYGTHTHVQTADESILNNKTAYITDVGMTGGHDGVIGMNKKEVIQKFKTGLPVKFTVCETNKKINAIEVLVDDKTNYAVDIKRINLKYEEI